jgi:hypothetical protein
LFYQDVEEKNAFSWVAWELSALSIALIGFAPQSGCFLESISGQLKRPMSFPS